MSNPPIYHFGPGRMDSAGPGRELLGGKGAALAEMTRIGLPVPPGFTITTEVCPRFQRDGRHPEAIREAVIDNLRRLEDDTGKRLGCGTSPLLMSVRSGAAESMPGMMDSILNLGPNDTTVAALAASAGELFTWDSFRRLVRMYGEIVFGVPAERFQAHLEDHEAERRQESGGDPRSAPAGIDGATAAGRLRRSRRDPGPSGTPLPEMQDIEFTVERGTLHVPRATTAAWEVRPPRAARIARAATMPWKFPARSRGEPGGCRGIETQRSREHCGREYR